jgi:putative ABC transport system ATP-binding protein
LIASLTVMENLRLAAYLAHTSVSNQEIISLLSSLGLAELTNRKPFEISQGQAQRVGIARAVVNKPQVIFADEPTASLDDESCEAVLRLLVDQADRHQSTLIMATHDQRVKSSFTNHLML